MVIYICTPRDDDKMTNGTDSDLFNSKLKDIISVWETKLDERLKDTLSVAGLIKAIKVRGNLCFETATVEDSSFSSNLPPVVLLSKILKLDGFSIKEPHRQLSSLSHDDFVLFLEFKIKQFIQTSPLIKSKDLKQKLLSNLPELLRSLGKNDKNENISKIVKAFLKEFNINNQRLISGLSQSISQNGTDAIVEAVRFMLSEVKINHSPIALENIHQIQDSAEPFKLWLDIDASDLDSTTINQIKPHFLPLDIPVDDTKALTSFENKVQAFVLAHLSNIQTVINSTRDLSYKAQIIPLLSKKANRDTIIQSPDDYLSRIEKLPSRPFEWNSSTNNILVAGENLKKLDLGQFLEALDHDKDLSEYFDALSEDITKTSFYQNASFKDKQILLKS